VITFGVSFASVYRAHSRHNGIGRERPLSRRMAVYRYKICKEQNRLRGPSTGPRSVSAADLRAGSPRLTFSCSDLRHIILPAHGKPWDTSHCCLWKQQCLHHVLRLGVIYYQLRAPLSVGTFAHTLHCIHRRTRTVYERVSGVGIPFPPSHDIFPNCGSCAMHAVPSNTAAREARNARDAQDALPALNYFHLYRMEPLPA
jgi:hypothetical protein